MKAVYLQPFDDCIKQFTYSNIPLQQISESHVVLFVDTNGDGVGLYQHYREPKIVHSKRNMASEKLYEAVKYLKGINFDVVIRTCPDALIMNNNHLLGIVGQELDLEQVEILGKYKKRKWIRGGCQVMTKKLVDAIDLNKVQECFNRGHNNSNDKTLMYAIEGIDGLRINDQSLFEQGKLYKKTKPVWHPPKESMEERFGYFERTIKEFVSGLDGGA